MSADTEIYLWTAGRSLDSSDQERILQLWITFPEAQNDCDGPGGKVAILLGEHWIPLDPEPIRGLIKKGLLEWEPHSLSLTDKGIEAMRID